MKLISYEKLSEGTSDDWATPPEIYAPLNRVFNFRIDVAANEENAKREAFLGPGSRIAEDALKSLWGAGPCFCNPPFSQWYDFMQKALEQSMLGATVAFLVPPRCETEGFHDLGSQADEIIFIRRRVKFWLNGMRGERPGAASCVFIFRPRLSSAVYGTPRLVYWCPDQPEKKK